MGVTTTTDKRLKKLAKTFTTKHKGGRVQVEEIKINKIKLGENSRRDVSDEEIAGLMASIKESGLLQPIGVVESGTGFEVVYGNRRFLALSKLGKTSIPAVIHKGNKNDFIMKNLAENIQRRNISLPEAGRYFFYLSKDGLSVAEMSVRLGVPQNFIKSCLVAFNDIPEEFQDDIVQQTQTRTVPVGKISLTTATEIINAAKTMRLSKPDVKKLFRAAKKGDEYRRENTLKYASALKRGKKDFIEAVTPVRKVAVRFFLSETEHERLWAEHVEKGPFMSLSGLVVAILRGEKRETIKVLKNMG